MAYIALILQMGIYFDHFTISLRANWTYVYEQFSVMNIVQQYYCVISLKDLIYENKGK